MTQPTELRLALDVASLMRNAGRGPSSGCQRLRRDGELRCFLSACGPADSLAWDALRLHVRRRSRQGIGFSEVDAIRQLLPEWRAQGRLLRLVRTARERKATTETEPEQPPCRTPAPLDGISTDDIMEATEGMGGLPSEWGKG